MRHLIVTCAAAVTLSVLPAAPVSMIANGIEDTEHWVGRLARG